MVSPKVLASVSMESALTSSASSSSLRTPLRVLFATGIYFPEMGGPATHVRTMARAFHEKGWTPIVVAYGDMQVPSEGWEVVRVSRRYGPLIRYVRYAMQVWKLAKNADLVYLQGGVSEGLPGTIGALLAGKGSRLMMRVPGDYAWEMSQQQPGALFEPLDTFVERSPYGVIGLLARLERWTASKAKAVIAPSQYIKKIVTAWGVTPEKIQVIYSAVPPLPSGRSREEVRAAQGWSDRVILFTVVRAVPWKGVDFLLKVLSELPETHVLCVAGDGPLLAVWQAQAESLGLAARVIFLGRVDRAVLAGWYEAADLFLLATGYEGFSHVVVEAVSTGLPCVVSSCAGNPETMQLFPEHVRVCSYQDHEAWKQACLMPVSRAARLQTDAFHRGTDQLMEVIQSVCAS